MLVHEPGVPEPLVHVVPGLVLHNQKPLDAGDGRRWNGAPDRVWKHESRVSDLIRNWTVLFFVRCNFFFFNLLSGFSGWDKKKENVLKYRNQFLVERKLSRQWHIDDNPRAPHVHWSVVASGVKYLQIQFKVLTELRIFNVHKPQEQDRPECRQWSAGKTFYQ